MCVDIDEKIIDEKKSGIFCALYNKKFVLFDKGTTIKK